MKVFKFENLVLINWILRIILFFLISFIFYFDIDFIYNEEIKNIKQQQEDGEIPIFTEKKRGGFQMVEEMQKEEIKNIKQQLEDEENSWLTEREREDLKIAKEITINFIKILILLFSLAGFTVLLFCCILVFDIANAHRYQRPQ